MTWTPRRLGSDDADLRAALALIQSTFAYMDGRVDPPSSAHRLTESALRDTAARGEVWGIGAPLKACMILTPRAGWLYLGKLAVDPDARHGGLARQLVDHAMSRASLLGLKGVEAQSRVELTEVHAAFLAMGFVRVGETAHAGFSRPTSFTFRRRQTVR